MAIPLQEEFDSANSWSLQRGVLKAQNRKFCVKTQ
jgi:hypothetical protein